MPLHGNLPDTSSVRKSSTGEQAEKNETTKSHTCMTQLSISYALLQQVHMICSQRWGLTEWSLWLSHQPCSTQRPRRKKHRYWIDQVSKAAIKETNCFCECNPSCRSSIVILKVLQEVVHIRLFGSHRTTRSMDNDPPGKLVVGSYMLCTCANCLLPKAVPQGLQNFILRYKSTSSIQHGTSRSRIFWAKQNDLP